MSVGIKDLKQIQKRLEDLRIKQFGGISIEEMDSELHSIEMDVFKLMDKASVRNKPKLKNRKLPIQRVIKSVCDHPWEQLESVMGDGVLCRKCNTVIKQTVL